MLKIVPAVAMASVLALAAPAHAQRLDLATYKCKIFLSSSPDLSGQILMWLQAYFSEENASPIVDFARGKEQGDRIRDYCAKNPEHSLIVAANKILGR